MATREIMYVMRCRCRTDLPQPSAARRSVRHLPRLKLLLFALFFLLVSIVIILSRVVSQMSHAARFQMMDAVGILLTRRVCIEAAFCGTARSTAKES